MARSPEQPPSLLRWAIVAATLVSMVAADASGQVMIRRIAVPGRLPAAASAKGIGGEPAADAGENVFLRPDRELLKKLSESRKLLAAGRFGEAVRNLDIILEGPEDFFIEPEKNSGRSCGLKAEAERLIGQMPREGRDLYELQYGPKARQMLNDALAASDASAVRAGLAGVSRQFFHTHSGYEATFLLGLHYFDHGDAMLAARTLQRLAGAGQLTGEFEPALSLTMAASWLQAGVPDKAREALIALRQQNPRLRVTVAGRETPIFANDADALDWLVKLTGASPTVVAGWADRWLMFRGDAARNASMPGSAPLLNMRWRVLSTADPQEEKKLTQQRKKHPDDGGPVIPALHPLAVGNVLLMRTLETLLAVDIATGKLLWEVPVDEPEDRPAGTDTATSQQFQIRQQIMAAGGNQRIISDMTYGTLSSDGHSVFSVEDAGAESASPASMVAGGRAVFVGAGVFRIRGRGIFLNGFNGNNEDQPALCNVLTAHDIRTGKLKWQIGGPACPHALPLAGTFFLGPPLPLHSRLYVLAENEQDKGVIRLLALDAATGVDANGKPRWSQPLAMSDDELGNDPPRRLAGASPSYADGILVCPTASGAIVGVDLTTRSLLWGYCFSSEGNNNRRNMGMFPAIMSHVNEPQATHWLDDSVSICEGRVLTTPDQSEWLYCLGLVDGELLWKCRRKDDLYVACVDRDKVVLVGRNAVRAVRLADGQPAWQGRVVSLPGGSSPSGRGFLSGDRYFVPLSSAEVVGIDLTAGKIVQTAKSRKGVVPGNLVCFKENVVSQGLEGVDAFYQLDAVSADVGRRLAANPNDAEALSLQGEILLDKGKRAQAIAAFVRANELQGEPRTRELLRDAILEGLRSDFARYRDQAWRCERLADDASQRAAFLRAMATGLRKAGELSAAFDYYEKLADAEPKRLPLDEIDKSLSVRRDRWLFSQLGELRRDAQGETAERIDRAVAARFGAAKAANSLDPLQRFVDTFGSQPAAADARAELIRRLDAAGQRLEAELAALPAGERGGAGNAKVAAKPAAKHDADWPVGKVEVKTRKVGNAARNNYGRVAFSLRGDRDPCFRDVSLQFDYNRRAILAYDGLGHEKWQVSLAPNDQQQYYAFNSSLNHGRTVGHLLLVSLGWKIAAIDTLGVGPNGSPRTLWTHDMMGQSPDASESAFQPQLAMWNWQQQRQFSLVHDQSKLLSLVRPGYACLQRFHSVVALDPRTGETLWSRQDMPYACDLFGDDEYVFVLPPDTDEATVLRARDGELVGKRRVPRIMGGQAVGNGEQKEVFGRFEETCLATLGRKMLLWWPQGNQRELTLVDPLEGCDLWRGRKFTAKAHVCVLNNEVVGVMEPSGRFVLLSLPEGHTIADLKLEAEPSLSDIALDSSGQQYLLLTSSSQGEANAQHFQPMPGSLYRPIHHGRLYAIDPQGKLQWPAPAVIKNQYLPANQPAGVPVVTFACQTYQPRTKGQSHLGASLLCIDKRNGRTVFEKEFDTTTGLFEITGDAAKKTVDLTMQQSAVTLTFTNKPLPPPSAADATSGKASQPKKTLRALWDAVQRTLNRGDDDSGREGD